MAYRKYNAHKATVDGITFDSQREANRYCELKLMEKAGQITSLELQPEFELQPKYRKHGRTVRAIIYRADFRYKENGVMVVEDVKGMRTDVYRMKKKMLEYRYPEIDIRET